MTAEIAILNRMGVALATDSAVTIGTRGGPKIYNSVNKLFALSKFEPVGIMIYGSADFMTIPWEVIVKQFRAHLGEDALPNLKDYVDRFLLFLSDSANPLFPESVQEAFLENHLGFAFSKIKEEVNDRVQAIFDRGDTVTETEIAAIVRDEIGRARSKLAESDNLKDVTPQKAKRVIQARKEVFERVREDVFEKLPMSPRVVQRLMQVATLAVHKSLYVGDPYSGIVFAGFGTEEHYPSLYAYEVEGVIDGLLRYEEHNETVIGPGQNAAAIRPFAQGEMVHMFMRGMDPSYNEVLDGFVKHVMRKMPDVFLGLPSCDIKDRARKDLLEQWEGEQRGLVEQFHSGLETYAQEQFVQPVVELVASLPKDELGAMAEAFVNLTSFRRKVTPEIETVGGPIDVAVITKGDGFIWINRKHYFNPALNPHFFANYFRDVGRGAQE